MRSRKNKIFFNLSNSLKVVDDNKMKISVKFNLIFLLIEKLNYV